MNTCQQHTATLRGAQTISRRLTPTLAVMIVFSLGAAMAAAQVPLINNPLVPEQKAPGAATFTLTVNGSGFASNAVVKWNGTALTTTFVKSSQLTASVPAADLVSAGTATVTVTNGTGVASNPAHFQVVKNGYTQAFANLNYATDVSPQDAVAADFNGDGFLDLAVATGNNSVSILMGNGTGAFPSHVQYAVPGDPVGIIAGDFNGDGKVDLVTVDQFQSQISVLLGNNDGTFAAHHEYATGTKPVFLAAGDFNGDGKLDIVVCDNNASQVSVLIGNGDGTFKTHKEYATGVGPSAVAVGDFNGDGRLDLAVANTSDATVSILFGNGDGTFQAGIAYPTSIAPNSVVVGDFNGDGILDLGVGTSNKSVSVLLGVANGTFQNHKEYTIGANAVVVAAADLSSNGKLSLVSANFNDNSVSVLGGNGDGTFKSQAVFPVNGGPAGLAIGDFNNNGKLDIAVAASASNTVSILTDSPITVSPGLLSFGTQTSGFKSAPKNVTVKNTGTTAWTMGTISFAGTDASDFTQTNTCPASVAAGASCTISVTFEPTACEVADAQILITPTTGGQLGNVLTGSGNTPITLTPRTQTFPNTLLFATSAAKSNTFTNNSGIDLVFSKIDLEGVNQNDFLIQPSSTCLTLPNATLAPGASCTSNVTFTPTFQPAGNETVTQVYYANICLVKQGLLINGEGTAVKVSPTTLSLSTSANKSVSKNVTFQNAATSPMAISSINFVNGNGNVWSQTNTCNFPNGSVPASSSCTITVSCNSATDGTFTANMNIGDPDWTGPQKVSLTCTVTN